MSDIIRVSQGLGSAWTITARAEDGTPYTGFAGTEPLSASVRVGRDQPVLFTLSPSWLDHTQGTVTLPIPGSSTAAVLPGRYLLDVFLTDLTADLYEGFLEVQYSAGAAAALVSYGSFADMVDRAPWIEKLQRDTDLAGFARQRYLARRWFEDLLHRHYRYDNGLSTDFQFVPGISFGGWWGNYYRTGKRSVQLQTWLDSNFLFVTDPVIDAVSHHAIALLCDRQVTPGKEDSGYGQAAAKYHARAEDTAMNITAELDTNGDGKSDVLIRLGSADTLVG
jgi:hypothetical protein